MPTTQPKSRVIIEAGAHYTEDTHKINVVVKVYDSNGEQELSFEAWVLGATESILALGSFTECPWTLGFVGATQPANPRNAHAWLLARRLLPANAERVLAKLVKKQHCGRRPKTRKAADWEDFKQCYTAGDGPGVVNMRTTHNTKFSLKVSCTRLLPLP